METYIFIIIILLLLCHFTNLTIKAMKLRRDNLSTEQALYNTSYERTLYDKGYIFCGLYRMSDIVSIAERLKIKLEPSDIIQIVGMLKKDFSIDVGIDAHRIKMYILRQQAEKRSYQEG